MEWWALHSPRLTNLKCFIHKNVLFTLKSDLCEVIVSKTISQPHLNYFEPLCKNRNIYFYADVCFVFIAHCGYSNSFTFSVTASTVSLCVQFLRHDSPSCTNLWPTPLKQHVKWCNKNSEGDANWQPRFKALHFPKSKHPVLWWRFDHEDHSVTLKCRVQLRPINVLLQIQ